MPKTIYTNTHTHKLPLPHKKIYIFTKKKRVVIDALKIGLGPSIEALAITIYCTHPRLYS